MGPCALLPDLRRADLGQPTCLEELDRRGPDSEAYIRPQQRWADIVVSFRPGDRGDQDHLDAALTLRDGLGHPDLSALTNGDARGLFLREAVRERHLRIPGDIDPAAAAEVEEAIWDRMHFASHLRSERLGEFTLGTELHRSDSLALVQLLILYHLVTAKASPVLAQIHHEVAMPKPARRIRGGGRGAAECRLHSRGQLGEAQRLGDVVVRAELQPTDLVSF